MNRKVILLNLVLAALAGWLGWSTWTKWRASNTHTQKVLATQPKPPVVIAPPAPAPAKPAEPAEYIDVSSRLLYSKDRNSNVIVEAPPPPPPPPPMPPLPLYHGQMSFASPVIILSTEKITQKSYAAGQSIGPFKIVAFDRDSVTFEWDGKEVVRKVNDLRPKEDAIAAAAAAAGVNAAAPPPVNAVRSLGSIAATSDPSKPQLGDVFGDGRSCVAGDTSPAGTVLDGYRKVITRGLMGQQCVWEKIK